VLSFTTPHNFNSFNWTSTKINIASAKFSQRSYHYTMLLRKAIRLWKTNPLNDARFLSTGAFNQQKKNSKSWITASTGAILLGSAVAASSPLFERHGIKTTVLEAASTISADEEEDETTTIINWSGTHSVQVANKNYFEPETTAELQQIVASCHEKGQPLRPVGSAISPNAISFNSGGMISLVNLDRIVKVDKENMTVTVEAGARVSQVVDALRGHGLTLPNLASIAEQQMGGFTQIGAHGTGAKIPPVDEFVTSLKLVTPARGTVELTKDDGEMFQLAKVGLGCLGVVSEVTMKVVPAHNLLEHTYVLTRLQAKAQLNDLLKKHKHIRYMWIPYQDTVVVVTNDEEDENSAKLVQMSKTNREGVDSFKPLRDLLKELSKDSNEPFTEENLEGKGFGELRDSLLAFKPMNGDHVKIVNEAESKFWKKSEGYQIRPSDELLQFDCGGQQWVFEFCFPTGTYDNNAGNDIKFMENLLRKIETEKIPAHAPIEQRWSANSNSLMSPAHGPDGGLTSWVG
jgi:L-galactono-1,4-lactone dehydrogenase